MIKQRSLISAALATPNVLKERQLLTVFFHRHQPELKFTVLLICVEMEWAGK